MDVFASEIRHSLHLSMYLPRQADLTEIFYFSEKFLAIKLESIESEVQKTIESRQH